MTTKQQALELADAIETAAEEQGVTEFNMLSECGCVAGILGGGEAADYPFETGIDTMVHMLGGVPPRYGYNIDFVKELTTDKASWPVARTGGTNPCGTNAGAYYGRTDSSSHREIRTVPVDHVVGVFRRWAENLPEGNNKKED